ncbi:response regulator [Exilibacterium tricleocarpae]|uniref:Response regulator n=1 Tax=Exilibacterium tricleocarpae TaxID=2591008 RepID=A0A545SMX6_9GAMM|nr:response regulator [Exilibacterium tricleocarpae]TQV66315.1 response regulator [Exilibacterium tricleocarpae]
MSLSLSADVVPKPQLIIAEDDPDDQMLMKDALVQNGVREKDVRFASDGQELLSLLACSVQNPAIILLDLNMPRKDGRQTLREIKGTESYKHIPVIVFTTSSSDEDILLTYQQGGNTFFTKPSTFDELVDIFALIKKYWIETAVLTR